jgi:hypothetical protein
MKKLLLVLTVVAMASFLFVGCDFPGAPPVDPPVEPPVEPTAITATIGVATETAPNADGKIFVKGGSREITVTFSDVVENPVVKVGTVVVPLFTVDNKVFKGPGAFVGNGAVLITVGGVCDDDLCEAKSVVVDSLAPVVELEAKAAECDCEDSYALTITSEQKACDGCVVDPGCCKDAGSGVASWNVKIFDANPWEIPYVDPCTLPDCEPCCSDDPCITPIKELDGTACPIVVTTECIAPELVWDAVADEFVAKTYFEKFYWVIATLTDNVGNKTTYKGLVSPSTVKADNYVSYFAEIYHGANTVAADYPIYPCWCYAEDYLTANSVLGDCAGFPATGCWEPELEPCPVVTLDPVVPMVGEEVTITIDYDVLGLEAEKPTGVVNAYVGPAIKIFPVGIPEDAKKLLVTDNEDWTYTATYTFNQAGTDTLYVTDGCADCPVCEYEITVVPIPLVPCPVPVVTLSDDTPMVDQVIEITFSYIDSVTKPVAPAAYVGPAIKFLPFGIPEDAQQLALTDNGDDTYTATYAFGQEGTDLIYVTDLSTDC